jgi:hypothetical protein
MRPPAAFGTHKVGTSTARTVTFTNAGNPLEVAICITGDSKRFLLHHHLPRDDIAGIVHGQRDVRAASTNIGFGEPHVHRCGSDQSTGGDHDRNRFIANLITFSHLRGRGRTPSPAAKSLHPAKSGASPETPENHQHIYYYTVTAGGARFPGTNDSHHRRSTPIPGAHPFSKGCGQERSKA